jgi:hypothetical protein
MGLVARPSVAENNEKKRDLADRNKTITIGLVCRHHPALSPKEDCFRNIFRI